MIMDLLFHKGRESLDKHPGNPGLRSTSSTGITGITHGNSRDCWDGRQRWRVVYYHDSNTIHLGAFTDFIEAVATRLAMEECMEYRIYFSPAREFIRNYLKGE